MKLVFVYNAKAGLAAAMMDMVHKTVSPDSYPCSLCAISYGTFSMQPRWRQWLKSLSIAQSFYHREDFCVAFPNEAQRPLPLAALVHDDGAFDVLIGAEQMDGLPDLDALMAAMETTLAQRGIVVG
jgi:hypothetical protein